MNLEKLNREFDNYLDTLEVTDHFSTSRVMNFSSKKRVPYFKIMLAICTIFILFLVGKNFMPNSVTPIVPTPSEKPIVDESDNKEDWIFEEKDGAFYLNGITLIMSFDEIVNILGEDYMEVENSEEITAGYGYMDQKNLVYEDRGITLVFAGDKLMELRLAYLSNNWVQEWFDNYFGKKYASKMYDSYEDPNSIRLIYSDQTLQNMYVKSVPVHEQNPTPYFILFYKYMDETTLYDKEPKTLTFDFNSLKETELTDEEQQIITQYYYEKVKEDILNYYSYLYYHDINEIYYDSYDANEDKIVIIDVYSKLVPKAVIEQDETIMNFQEQFNNEQDEKKKQELLKQLEEHQQSLIQNASEDYNSHFAYAVYFRGVFSDLYLIDLASDNLTLNSMETEE